RSQGSGGSGTARRGTGDADDPGDVNVAGASGGRPWSSSAYRMAATRPSSSTHAGAGTSGPIPRFRMMSLFRYVDGSIAPPVIDSPLGATSSRSMPQIGHGPGCVET